MEKPMEETVPAKIVSCKEKSNEDKTIFGILSKIKDIDTKVKPEFESRDTVTFRRDPSLLNKSAYAKLHRSVSPTRSNSVNKIKLKYESDTDVSAKETENTNDKQTLESLKNKYSPASFGYPKIPPKPNLPLPKKRNSKSHIFLPPKKEITESKTRFSLDLDKHKNAEKKDQNSNILRKSLSSSEEYLSIVRQSESEESIDRFQKELSAFTMDKKKRSNSFKKLFTGNFFGKSKKKKEEEKNKTQNVEIGAYRENIQNETHNFNRHSPFRHTTGCTNTKEVRIKRNESEIDEKELERRYAEMHINQFNQAKHNFEKMNSNETPLGYVPMDKPISKTNQQNTYMNMPNIRRYIDTSSSGSTLDSDRSNLNQKDDVDFRYNTNSRRMSDGKRDTPPRAQETRQGVRLVNPKALIPINSERPLPNPYQTNDIRKDEDSSIISQTPRLEETYGTVLDSLPQMRRKEASRKSLNEQEPSRSPNLEPTKLKLPPNREIIPLSPRLKSPIPHEHISTEKLIATELLKPAKSPTPNKKGQRQHSPSHQRLEIDIDYPEDKLLQNHPNSTLTSKPPLAALKKPQVDRNSQHSPQESRERITTSVMVHSSSDRTPTPSSSLQNRSMSPVRPLSVRSATPVDSRVSQSPKTTPQKEEMRRNVEAYYWKEIKKMKDQENYDMYIYQMQDCVPYSYEDPVMVRRSRSLSPTAHRNSRRSLSLPRENKQVTHQQENPYGRHPGSIPEDRAVIHQRNVIHNQNFIRNTPSRQTVDSMPTNYNNYNNSLYRPIFKRGSMNAPPTQQYTENQDKRKVSFSGSQGAPQQSWPTKNGFTKSPPQRRIVERRDSNLDDDVFLPNTPHTNGNEIYGWHNENIYTQRNLLPKEPLYVSRVPNTRYIQNNQQIYGHLPAPRPVLNRTGATRPEESLYGQPVDAIRTPQGLTRHGSMQIPLNGQYVARRTSYENYPVASTPDHRLHLEGKVRREIIINDEIFGQIGGYLPQPNGYLQMRQQSNPVYSSRQSVADSAYGRKQVSVSNKVCDIYGQIHETDRGVQQSGVLMGQLHRNPGSPLVVRQSYNQLPINENFVRNSRLTASANDMYRRGMRSSSEIRSPSNHNAQFDGYVNGPPTRPLPPIPQKKKGPLRNVIVSDTESGSDVSEIQRIMGGNVTVKKRGIFDEEWNADGKQGRSSDGARSDNEGGEVRGRSRNVRRDDPRRHTLGGDQQYLAMAAQGGPLSRTMDLEGQPRGYPPPSNAMLFDDDPGIMSEVETSSTGFRRGGKQRSSLPVVRTPSKTLERPLGLVFLQYRNETKRALLPNEITSIDTVKALFVRSFPKQLTMEYLDSPNVKIYIHDSSKDMFYELEDLRSHLREIRDRSVLRLFESADVSGGLPMAGIGISGSVGHFEDPSYFSEPEFDSEYQHQHIHKSKGKGAPYYMGSTASLPRAATFLRTYSPAVPNLPADRLKPLPTDGYMSSPERGSRYEDPYYSQYATRSGSITPVIDEEISDTELLDDSYSLYGVKLPAGAPRTTPRAPFPAAAPVPYDATRLRVENMERQLANLTGLVQKALTQPASHLQVPGRDGYRTDDSYLRTDSKAPKLGKSGCHKSVSFEKSVSFSDEPPDMNSPKQHSPQHAADTKPAKPAIKSSTLPRTSSQERDRLKPAPPPKPASLSPGQYDCRAIYRDLQLTPEMYNQLRGLQKKAKDLRAEVRNLRRMSQAQAHSVKETIRDTFIKIRAVLLAGGEQVWQADMDQERVRLTREEDLYKQEMLRLEKDLSELESTVEELRGNVINRKTRVNMSDVENMALVLSKSSKTVADLKLRFPGLQDSMKNLLATEMDKMVREEKFLKEEPERLESALRRCKKLTGTLVTLKRLASVQEQRLPCSNSTNDGRLSPTTTETPPITPPQTSKPPTASRVGSIVLGGECAYPADGSQRPENALDALLDELQTFSKPHAPDSEPPAIPAKGILPNRPPQMSEIGRKGSMDSASFLPSQNLTVSTATGSLRRLHSYPSGSDTDNSPPIQPFPATKTASKPPIPERNAELLQHVTATGRRIPPPPPPRTSSKSPLASPTSPCLPPRSPAAALQHIQNVQNMEKPPMSQFEQATQNLGLQTLRRNVSNRSSLKENKSQTLPRNIGSHLHIPSSESEAISASNSSSCESVNSQDGSKKTRKEELEHRHQELLKKQKALQEQYARLQQLQRGSNTLAVVPPTTELMLKKTGSESNLLHKMGLQLSTSAITGSLTNLPGNTKGTVANSTIPGEQTTNEIDQGSNNPNSQNTTSNMVYETDIL